MKRNDNDYDELKEKYEDLLKKQQERAFGKCWDGFDEEENEEYGNLALMAHLGDKASPSSHQVPLLTTFDMTTSQNRKIV